MLSSRLFGRKKSGDVAEGAPGTAGSLARQKSWTANGMPAPPKAVVEEVTQKRVETGAAVKLQSGVRQKQAVVLVEGKKQQRKQETTAATKIQAIKRGQQARAEVDALRPKTWGRALQRCVAPMVARWGELLARCPCTSPEHTKLSEQQLQHAMPKGAVQLSPELEAQLRELFGKMDRDNDTILSKAEAVEFWGKNFAKINAQAMFNEVDDDQNETISIGEWLDFWKNVLAQDCYTEEDIAEEVESMLQGGSWVDWQDGRTT